MDCPTKTDSRANGCTNHCNVPVRQNQQNINDNELSQRRNSTTREVVLWCWSSTALVVMLALLATSGRAQKLAQCPPESILAPCSCALSQIYCYNQAIVRVKPIFDRVAYYLLQTDDTTTEFISLELDGLAIRYLEANFTAGLRFETVALKNLRHLAGIDRDAFNCTADRVQQLSFEGATSQFITKANLPRLAALVSSMAALRRLYFDAHHLVALPRHLFAHNQLTDLSFNYNRQRKGQLSVVHDEAFYYLPSLKAIDLYGQNIGHLSRDTFRFQLDNDQLKTAIFLQENGLTTSSFEVGLFDNIKRKLIVYLNENNLTYVDQAIFEPLLKGNNANMVDFSANPLQMSCRNRWISTVDNRYKQFLGALIGAPEGDHRVLVTLDPEDYSTLHCDVLS